MQFGPQYMHVLVAAIVFWEKLLWRPEMSRRSFDHLKKKKKESWDTLAGEMI